MTVQGTLDLDDLRFEFAVIDVQQAVGKIRGADNVIGTTWIEHERFTNHLL